MDTNAHTFNTYLVRPGSVHCLLCSATITLVGQHQSVVHRTSIQRLVRPAARHPGQPSIGVSTQWGDLGQRLLTGQPFSFEDRRFSSGNWSTPLFGSLAAFYLLNAGFLLKLLDKLPIKDKKPRQRLLYLVEQAIAAGAPSNFSGQQSRCLAARRRTLRAAACSPDLLHLASDLQEGKMRQCDSGAFKVGVDLANTPGEVVFENELFQLIQYYPQSETQYRRPVFIVPPSINKYYILDLRPDNSMVRHLLQQGHPVFLMSWRNFDQAHAGTTWDDLIETGIIKGLQVTREISGEQRPNCVRFLHLEPAAAPRVRLVERRDLVGGERVHGRARARRVPARPRADRSRRPLLAYAYAELGVALFALLVPVLLEPAGPLAAVNACCAQRFGAESLAFMIARFLCIVPVLIVPTTLMGATLPLLARHFVRRARTSARRGRRARRRAVRGRTRSARCSACSSPASC